MDIKDRICLMRSAIILTVSDDERAQIAECERRLTAITEEYGEMGVFASIFSHMEAMAKSDSYKDFEKWMKERK